MRRTSCIRGRWLVVLTLLAALLGADAHAQETAQRQPLRQWFAETDSTLLFDIYALESSVITGHLRLVHVTAKPFIGGSGFVVALGEWASGDPTWEHPLSMFAAQGTGYLLQYGLKELLQRPRPYGAYPSIQSRSASHPSMTDPYTMPSGHATLAFATATTLSLAYPRWYVVGPSALWAGSVSLSRPWLGVHYPSDIVVGAVLGAALGIGMHFIVPEVMPRRLR